MSEFTDSLPRGAGGLQGAREVTEADAKALKQGEDYSKMYFDPDRDVVGGIWVLPPDYDGDIPKY